MPFIEEGKYWFWKNTQYDGARPMGPHYGWRHGIVMDPIDWMWVLLRIASKIETLFFTQRHI